MNNINLLLTKPNPNIAGFIDVLTGKDTSGKAPLAELLIDRAVMKPVIENMIGLKWAEGPERKEYIGSKPQIQASEINRINQFLNNTIQFWYRMGYDYVRIAASLELPAISHLVEDTAKAINAKNRAWQQTSEGPIKNWKDFENYPWPKIEDNDFYMHKYICKHLPENMGFISAHSGGVYEHTSRLIGYESLCLMLYDNPKLVKAVTDKVGELIERYHQHLLQFEPLVAIMPGDDFGFNTGTLIQPSDIRKYYLPWHKKYAKAAHDAGKLYILHSCGQITELMDDLIDDIQIDAKHSFQDNAMPILQSKQLYGDRVALIGGVDVDVLVTSQKQQLRKYVTQILEKCSKGGRFAIGSGNSIASYVPLENYLAMVDESLKWNRRF